MVSGQGIQVKYDAIITKRQTELYANIPQSSWGLIPLKIAEFKRLVRSCTKAEFNQWYDLYCGQEVRMLKGLTQLQDHK